MKIIGGKDYYDSAAVFGIDPGVTFNRKNFALSQKELMSLGKYRIKSIAIWDNRWPNDMPSWKNSSYISNHYLKHQNKSYDVTMYPRMIFFCGKVYTGIDLTLIDKSTYFDTKTSYWFWDKEKFDEFLAERNWKMVDTDRYYYERPGCESLEMFQVKSVSGNALQSFIDLGMVFATHIDVGIETHLERSRRDDDDSHWRVNGDWLKDYQFQKKFDPVSAYQEISMWLSGPLSTQTTANIVEITDDKIKIAKHGFDSLSFRKSKQ